MLPEQALAIRNAAHSAAAKQANSKSVTAVAPSSLPRAASANPGAASANPWPASENPEAASANPGAASANPWAASTSSAFARPRPFQPPGSAKTVSGISLSTRPESTSVTLDQLYPAAAEAQAEAAVQGRGSTSNAPETSALRDVVNQEPQPDTAVPHALPAKPQPGKKKHARPRVSSSVPSQAKSANSTAASLGSAIATSVQPHYSSDDNVLQHLASHASVMQNPARKITVRHDVDSFKQVWSELGPRGSDCSKEECQSCDDAPSLQSELQQSEYIESFLQ